MRGTAVLTLALIGSATLAAFAVLGVPGFGSSMIGIGAPNMVLPRAGVVPAVSAHGLLATVCLLRRIWRRMACRSPI